MSPDRTSVALAVLTRDLRVHDNPTLHGASTTADAVVPLFVLDDTLLGTAYNRPNRAAFLLECLRDLDEAFAARGSRLVVRRGDWVGEVVALAASTGAVSVHVAGDVSSFARARVSCLAEELRRQCPDAELVVHEETLFVVPPGEVATTGKNHMAVFTPYFRRWEKAAMRAPAPTPRTMRLPDGVGPGVIPAVDSIVSTSDISLSPDRAAGGETAGRAQMTRWLGSGLEDYDDDHDALGNDNTSRLSPYLHFGAISPVELVRNASTSATPAAAAFVRQVAWRDFYAQVLAARPDATREDYRTRGDRWHHDEAEIDAWKQGRTGYPIVDAGMRQLAREGWMHNRARLITAHFLCKTLYVDWRVGAQHFVDFLVDGDTASNTMNWQWVAGTGTDSRFNRTYNVVLQARRHDPAGAYVRRYVEELAQVDDAYLHEPWLLPEDQREELGYPAPIVDQDVAKDRLRKARGLS